MSVNKKSRNVDAQVERNRKDESSLTRSHRTKKGREKPRTIVFNFSIRAEKERTDPAVIVSDTDTRLNLRRQRLSIFCSLPSTPELADSRAVCSSTLRIILQTPHIIRTSPLSACRCARCAHNAFAFQQPRTLQNGFDAAESCRCSVPSPKKRELNVNTTTRKKKK